MPRLPFNTLCDIYKGPGTNTPGLFVGTFPCRFVVEDGIHAIGPGCPPIPAYLTIEGYQPQGAWTYPFFGMNSSLCDQIAIPSGGLNRFFVLYTDVIIWNGQAAYYRAYLVYLPLPTPGPSGGILWGGSANITYVGQYIGSGGILWGGYAAVTFNGVYIGSGGILWGGDADGSVTHMRSITGSGGILWGGSASVSFTPGTVYYWRDTFTDSNGTALTAHTGENTSGGYTATTGVYYIQSNKCAVSSFSGGYARTIFDNGHTAFTWTLDFTAPTTSTDSGDRYVVPLWRYFDGTNFWYALILFPTGSNTASSFVVRKVVSGSDTVVGTGTVSITAGVQTTFTLVLTTTTVSVTINGVNVFASDGSLSIYTKTGFQNNGTSFTTSVPVFDNNVIVP